jgi:excisionase family DNA binding protein
MTRRRWIGVSEAAEALNVSERQVRRLCASGQLAATRRADGWQVDADSLEERTGRELPADLDATIEKLAALASGIEAQTSVPDVLASILQIVREIQGEVRALGARLDAECPQRSVVGSVACATVKIGRTK